MLVMAAVGVAALAFFWPSGEDDALPPPRIAEVVPGIAALVTSGRVALENEHGRFVMEPQEDGWWLREPIRTPVSRESVAMLIGSIPAIRAVEEERLPDDPSRLGFDPPRGTVRLSSGPLSSGPLSSGPLSSGPLSSGALSSGAASLEIRLGVHVGFEPRVYARISGDERLWSAPEAMRTAAGRTLEELRSRVLVPLERHEVSRIHVAVAGRPPWSVVREARGWRLEGPASALVSEDALREILQAWCGMEVLAFVDDEPEDLAPYGLEPPHATARFLREGSSEALQVHVRLSEPAHDGSFLAYRRDWGSVVRVPALAGNRLLEDPLGLLDLRVLHADLVRLRSMTVDRGDDGGMALDRGPRGAWRLAEPFEGPANPDEVQLLTDGLLALQFEPGEPDRPLETGKVRFRAVTREGDRIGFDLGTPDGEGRVPLRRVPDGRTGYVAEEAVRFLETPYYWLHALEVTKLPPAALGGLRVTSGKRTVELVPGEGGWIAAEPGSPEPRRLDEQFMNVLATQWIDLWAKEYVASLADPPEGMDPADPDAVLELVGRPFDGGGVLATVRLYLVPATGAADPARTLPLGVLEGRPLVFRLPSEPVDRLKRACPFPWD